MPAAGSDLESLLSRGLTELGIEASASQVRAFSRLTRLLVAWAGRINLTAHRQPEAIVRRLVLDAAALGQLLPDFSSLADLGSGAGFPGLPIAILRPEARVILVESRERRHHFQRMIRRDLGLTNVSLLRGRIEDLPPDPCDCVVAQAVAPPDQVLEWMMPWVAAGGAAVIPSGDRPPHLGPHPAIEGSRVLRYRVPLNGPERTLWLGRRRAG